MKALLLLFLLPGLSSANELPKPGDLLETSSAATAVRESTPDATFGGQGRQIGWVKKGEVVRVLESRQYLSVFGPELWLKVEKAHGPAGTGWVLVGTNQEILKGRGNFKLTQGTGERPESSTELPAPSPSPLEDSQ